MEHKDCTEVHKEIPVTELRYGSGFKEKWPLHYRLSVKSEIDLLGNRD